MNSSPFVMGTRCRQLAMYVLYKGGLQMLSDLPAEYRKEPQILEFLKAVPVTWDETIVLQAKLGKHLLLARKSGTSWYIGAMNDSQPFETTLKLDFLDSGKKYTTSTWADGVNAGKNPMDFKVTKTMLVQGDTLTIQLAKAGGMVVNLDLIE
jgi:alpha-glucosidase